MYERLSKDRKLLDEDTISEDQSLFLVDFQQKVVENVITQRRSASKNQSKVGQHSSSDEEIGREDAYPAANPEEEWYYFIRLSPVLIKVFQVLIDVLSAV